METLDITLEKVMYASPNKFSESGIDFVIARGSEISTGKDIVVKGEMSDVTQYESYRLFGKTEYDEKYKQDTFKFGSFHIIAPQTKKGAYKYLIRYCKKVGPVSSGEIIEKFGQNVIDILIQDPERIFEVDTLSESQSQSVYAHFKSSKVHHCHAISELTAIFEGFKVSHKTIESIVDVFGSSSMEMINKNPYILLNFPRMGFDTVDAIARQRFNIGVESPMRIVAAIGETAKRQSDIGHTCYSKADLEKGIFELVGSRTKEDWLDWAIRDEILIRCTVKNIQVYQLVDHYQAERLIAANIARLTRDVLPIDAEINKSSLEGDQLAIPDLIFNNGVSVLAGIPGSGKTYAISYICNELEKLLPEMIFTFAAPTGRAAKRLKELLDHHGPNNKFSCSTIHKVLRWVFSEEKADVPESVAKPKRGRPRFQFSDDEEGLPVGLYIIEESSMVDIFMASALLSKIPSGSRVVFVGDPYQLPSIRCGSFLRDILNAGVPSIKLETPRRNAGKIVRACYEIKSGLTPRPSSKIDLEAIPAENWIHIEQSDPENIQKVIVALYQKTKMDKFWDIQTISPQKESDFIGCNDLNKVLSKLLNPSQVDVMGNQKSSLPFTIGDKIIRTKNGVVSGLTICGNNSLEEFEEYAVEWGDRDLDEVEWNNQYFTVIPTPIVNGDMGIVLGSLSYKNKWHVIIEFKNPTRLCILPISEHKLELGYCTTVHKMQGSGARCIIAPISDVFYSGLVTRELGYTMFSRAEERLYTTGKLSSLGESIKRKSIDQRRTRLKDFVIEVMKGQENVVSSL